MKELCQVGYRNERHLPACIEALDVAGKKVLEIGLGAGAESERLISQGARWSGVDLTAEAVERVRTRLTPRELPYEELRQGSVLTCRSPTTARGLPARSEWDPERRSHPRNAGRSSRQCPWSHAHEATTAHIGSLVRPRARQPG